MIARRLARVPAATASTTRGQLLTGDLLDPRPERMRYAVRALFLVWIYAWGIASDVVAKGGAPKPEADAVTRGMTASVVACTLWVVAWELVDRAGGRVKALVGGVVSWPLHAAGFVALVPAGTNLTVAIEAPRASPQFSARRRGARRDRAPRSSRRRRRRRRRPRIAGAGSITLPRRLHARGRREPARRAVPGSGAAAVQRARDRRAEAARPARGRSIGEAIDDELRGESIVGAGDYQRARDVAVAWVAHRSARRRRAVGGRRARAATCA